MKLQTSMQSILVSIFRLGLLRLSAGTYEATSSTAANVFSHLEQYWPTSFQFVNVQKAFLLSLRGNIIANILRCFGRRESKVVRKNSKNCHSFWNYGFTEKNFKQKRPECPFKVKDNDLTFSCAVEIAVETEDAAKVAKETVHDSKPAQSVHKVTAKKFSKKTASNSRDSGRPKVKCFRCGKTNHVAPDCRFKDAVM